MAAKVINFFDTKTFDINKRDYFLNTAKKGDNLNKVTSKFGSIFVLFFKINIYFTIS